MSTLQPRSWPYAFGPQPFKGSKKSAFEREEVAGCINVTLVRLNLVLAVLETVNKPLLPAPGDSHLRKSCERALTSILFALANMSPAKVSNDLPGKEEKEVKSKLNNKSLSQLIDLEQLIYLKLLISRLLP